MATNSSDPGRHEMGKGIMVKLRHPSSGIVLSFVATEDGRLDVGTIAASFGLNPTSVKFNGHFVSKGPDFISCVTWKALLSYFVKKGFTTGKSDEDAILISGTLLSSSQQSKGTWINDNHSEDLNLLKAKENDHGTKRRTWLEDPTFVDMLKRRKKLEDSVTSGLDVDIRENGYHFQCSITFQDECNNCDIKRGRQEDFVHAAQKHMRLQGDSGMSPDDQLKSCEQIVWNGVDCLNVKCNSEMKKRMRQGEMLSDSPYKRAR